VQLKYRLYCRRNGVFYWQENDSSKQGTLRTNERREAERLLNAMNESHREPTLNLSLARAYLAAHDPKMAKRTWQAVMDEMATHGIPTTQERCARGFRSKAYDPIRNKPLVQTTAADLLAIIHTNGNCVAHYLRRLNNLAVDLGWLPLPALAKRAWPKIRSQSKRAITAEEHAAVNNFLPPVVFILNSPSATAHCRRARGEQLILRARLHKLLRRGGEKFRHIFQRSGFGNAVLSKRVLVELHLGLYDIETSAFLW
jgi:hypothetical protein